MPFRLPLPRRGTPPTAADRREDRGEIAAARNWEGDGPVSFDATGTAVRFTNVHPPKLMLWEITDEWEACEECTSGSSSSSSSSSSGPIDFPVGWCRAPAIPVLYFDGDRKWDQEFEGFDKFIFHPAGYPPDQRDDMIDAKIFMPRFNVGDWVWCVFNMQSGWWEITNAFEDIWRFELKTELVIGGTATAFLRQGFPDPLGDGLWETCTAIEFKLYDSLDSFSGAIGAKGIAKWFADARQWEILQMGCP